MSAKLGETLAGLLNASFGNAVEIIVGIAALFRGENHVEFYMGRVIHFPFQMNYVSCKPP